MRTAEWTQLLADPEPATRLSKVATALGFLDAAPLGESPSRALGVPDDVTHVTVGRGPGTTRFIGGVAAVGRPVREQAARMGERLTRKAPHLLWLLVLCERGGDEVVVAAWHPLGAGARVAALVIARSSLLPSDAETLGALVQSLADRSDLAIHQQWVEILGRESISRRFFQSLQRAVHRIAENAAGAATPDTRRELSLLYVSRLLFLVFLEERGWLDSDARFLSRTFDECMRRGGGYQRRVLEPLFFGTLNTPPPRRAARARSLGRLPFLNGGLFTRSIAERRARSLVMQDADFGELFDQLLLRYRFTAREDTSTWSEAAIDPEILGRAFESLMASAERRVTGAFYTPIAIVTQVADRGLEAALVRRGAPDELLERDSLSPDLQARLATALRGFRVLDPACGSGAFLVHVLDRLTWLRRRSGDERAPHAIRRDLLARSIFGVDVNPTAVWLCELRLWLALVIDHPAKDPGEVPALPNLDHNIRCGDTLAGGDFSMPAIGNDARSASLRNRYARATGARKRSLGRALDAVERRTLLSWLEARLASLRDQRQSLIAAARGRDLFGGRRGALAGERAEAQQLRLAARELRKQRRSVLDGGALPFVFAAQFPDVAADGGFDVIVGNPPWIRLHHIPATQREALRREFRVYREAAWVQGARSARAGTGFASQVDASSLFIERSHQLLRAEGVMALLVPAKLWRSLAGGGVRRLLTERAGLQALEDWSAAPALFDAATYPSMIVASRRPGDTAVKVTVHRSRVELGWRAPKTALPLDDSPGSPWLTLPAGARQAFDRLVRDGIPLAESGLGFATLGVKCGCNDAFLVEAHCRAGGVEISDGSRTTVLEAGLVRRVIRGESVRPWIAGDRRECIVFPHGDDGQPLERLSPALRSWLLPWRSRLEARSDARGNRAWWSLFRLEGSRFDRPRVVWADLGKSLQALVIPAGDRTVPLNTCYVLSARDFTDALTLAALLNSPVANAWIGSIAEPARGGYRRHFAWTMARLPVPDDWARARHILAPLGARGIRGEPPGSAEMMAAVLDAFRMRHRTVAPLIEWTTG